MNEQVQMVKEPNGTVKVLNGTAPATESKLSKTNKDIGSSHS